MKLRHLCLGGNLFLRDAIHEIMDSLSGSASLTHLDVSDCVLNPAASLSICDMMMECDQMAYLNLANCQLGSTGLIPLTRTVLVAHTGLTALDLSGNRAGIQGAGLIAASLVSNRSLRRLDLSKNDFGPSGGAKLIAGFRGCYGLVEIILDDNDFTDSVAVEVGMALNGHQNLRTVSLRDASLSTEVEAQVSLSFRNVPLEYLFVGKGEPVLNIVGAHSYQEYLISPLTYAVKHRWIELAEALIGLRNQDAVMTQVTDDEFVEESSSDYQITTSNYLQISDNDAADALHVLLNSSDYLYSKQERLSLIKYMLGEDGRRGLRLKTLQNVTCYTAGRSNVITAPFIEYLEDYWCCGAYRTPPALTEALDEPVCGWKRVDLPQFTDCVSKGQLDSRWRKVISKSYRYAEHGYWSLYWNPEESRSFCYDRRHDLERSDKVDNANSGERYFWLPKAEETMMMSQDSLLLELKKVAEMASKGFIYLEDESYVWLADIIRSNASDLRAAGLLKALSRNKEAIRKKRQEWEGLRLQMDTLNSRAYSYVEVEHPSAIQMGDAVSYVMCLAWLYYSESNNSKSAGNSPENEDGTASSQLQPNGLRQHALPWLKLGLERPNERRTALCSSLYSGKFEITELLLKRNFGRGLSIYGYSKLELKDSTLMIDSIQNIRLAYLFDQSKFPHVNYSLLQYAWEKPHEISIVFRNDPDLLLVNSRILGELRDEELRRLTKSYAVSRNGVDNEIFRDDFSRTAGLIGKSSKSGLLQTLGSWNFRTGDKGQGKDEFLEATASATQVSSLVEETDKSKRIMDSPLHIAARSGQWSLISVLLANGADFDPQEPFDSLRQLLCDICRTTVTEGYSSQKGVIEDVVTRILNCMDESDAHSSLIPLHESPLYAAVAHSREDIVKLLITEGKDMKFITQAILVDPSDISEANMSRGWTLLSKAVYLSQQGIVSALLGEKATPLYDTPSDLQFSSRCIPDAYSVALLRVHRQKQLVRFLNTVKKVDVPNRSIILQRSKEKLKIAKKVLGDMSEVEDVQLWRNTWITIYAFRISFFYLLFLIFFTFSVIFTSSINFSKYSFCSVASSKVIGDGVFTSIQSNDDVWKFLDSSLLPNLYPEFYGNGWLDQHNRLVGGIELIQIRDEDVCELRPTTVWRHLVPIGDAESQSCFSVTQILDERTILPALNASISYQMIEDLRSSNWIDGATRTLIIQYNVGNLPEHLLQLANLRIDFLPSGELQPSSNFLVLPVNALMNFSYADVMLAVVAVWNLIYLLVEGEEMFRNGLQAYSTESWNIFDIVVNILSLSWCFIIASARLLGQNRLNSSSTSSVEGTGTLDLWDVGLLYSHAEVVASVALMGAYIKIIKYLQYLPLIGADMMSLLRTLVSVRVMTFTVFVIFIILSLGIGVFVRFGGHAEQFATFGLSVFAIFDSLLGNSYFNSMLLGNDQGELLKNDSTKGGDTTAVLYFVVVSFVGSLIIVNLFVNVTGNVYDELHKQAVENWTNSVDSCMIDDKWRKIRNHPGRGFLRSTLKILWNTVRSVGNRLSLVRIEQSAGSAPASPYYQECYTGDWTAVEEAISVLKRSVILQAISNKLDNKEVINCDDLLTYVEERVLHFEARSHNSSWLSGVGARRISPTAVSMPHHDYEDGTDIETGLPIRRQSRGLFVFDNGQRRVWPDDAPKSPRLHNEFTSESLLSHYWAEQETARLLYKQRKVCHDLLKECHDYFQKLGLDVKFGASWWSEEKKNPAGQRLLLWDIDDELLKDSKPN